MKGIVIMLLLLPLLVSAQTTVRPQNESVRDWTFMPGEDLTYTVKYGFVKGGEGHFTVRDTVIDGRHANHIVCAGRTTGIADTFFKVRDSYESYLDAETQLSIMSKRNIREGKYTYNDVVVYDRGKDEIQKIIKKRNKPKIEETQPVPPRILDIVGAFYHARNNAFATGLTIGDTICYETFFSNEVFPLYIKYRGKEVIKTMFGKRECYKFSPITEVGRSFKTEDDMHLWVTTDGNCLPVKIKFDLAVGSFVCELTKASGLKN
ncbi:MAG: DUF3108 domain-containing protein [Bacteroidales bacterium]|nr:DUF3108 domain-containing protein [Bacteroidales bacterium]